MKLSKKNTGANSRLLKRQHHHWPTQPVRLIRSTHHFIFLARFCRCSRSGCRGNRALRPCHPAQTVGSTIFEDGMETFQMRYQKHWDDTKKTASTFPVEGVMNLTTTTKTSNLPGCHLVAKNPYANQLHSSTDLPKSPNWTPAPRRFALSLAVDVMDPALPRRSREWWDCRYLKASGSFLDVFFRVDLKRSYWLIGIF